MSHLWNRIAKLERYREAEGEDTTIRIHLVQQGDDQYPSEPGTRILHVEFGQSWWGEIGEDGVERWIANA